MKKILPLFLIAAVFLTNIPTVKAFYDINQENKYYKAITFLAEKNIIKGYDDDSFRPNNTITRAEFVKIIVASAGFKLNAYGSTGFRDIDESSWYAPYLRKAKTENIIDGYQDNTFRPADPITKAEAIKVIGVAQKWDTASPAENPFIDVQKNAWFAKYIYFAKTKKLIDQSRFFQPDAFITRGLTSDIIYKSDKYNVFKIQGTSTETAQIPRVSIPDVFKPIVSPEKPQIQSSETVMFSMMSKNFFENISLNADFPSHFYKNEIYKFEGSILSGSYDSIFIFLSYKDLNGNSKSIDFISSVKNNQFIVPVVFRYPGSYEIGIIPGTKGVSKIKRVSVLDNMEAAPSFQPQETISSININFKSGKTVVSFDRPQSNVIKATFKQGEKSISYISRQAIGAFDAPYQDFYEFSPDEISMTIESGQISSLFPLKLSSDWSGKTISFTATRHLFSKIENNKISVSGLPEKFSTPSRISFTGITNTETSTKAIVIKPNGLTEEINLVSIIKPIIINGAEALPKGSSYSFSYNAAAQGSYIIGINEITGSAILNTPVYIGKNIPLLPDFFDIKESVKTDNGLESANGKYLNWVNSARKKLGVNPVLSDENLTILAQKHSEDMAKNNYFSHINLNGKSPNDRRIELKIPTEVGENIAKTTSLTAGFEGFMRSPGHRKNILETKWTKVGFGFSKNSNNEILITQEFSSNPLTAADISKMENELLDYINEKRVSSNMNQLLPDADASNIAKLWSEKMAKHNFTEFAAPDGSTLTNIIKSGLSYISAHIFVYSQNTTELLKENVVNRSEILENSAVKIGIGMAVTSMGDIKSTIILTR